MKMKQTIKRIYLGLLILVSCLAIEGRAQVPLNSLFLNPTTNQAPSGTVFMVQIVLSNAQPFGPWNHFLRFNSNFASLIGASNGSESAGFRAQSFSPMSQAQISNANVLGQVRGGGNNADFMANAGDLGLARLFFMSRTNGAFSITTEDYSSTNQFGNVLITDVTGTSNLPLIVVGTNLFNQAAPGTPEIRVTGNGNDVIDGAGIGAVSLANNTDFGVTTVGTSKTNIFVITNTGGANLTIGGFTITGPYSLAIAPAANVGVGGSTIFGIAFNPVGAGNDQQGSVSFVNNDTDENPYDFVIVGDATAGVLPQEMNVTGNGITITNNDLTPASNDNTDFGTAFVGGVPVTRPFVIENLGGSNLTIGAITITPPNAGFTLTTPPGSPVIGGGNTGFSIQYSPTGAGPVVATVTIPNNDGDENPYVFAIQGTGSVAVVPEIEVAGNGQPIIDGSVNPIAANGTDLGLVPVGGSVTGVFTIQNIGLSNLNITTPIADPGNGFTVLSQPGNNVLAPSSNTSFTIRFNAVTNGIFTANVSFGNSDSDENPFDFAIRATTTQQVVNVDFNSLVKGDFDTNGISDLVLQAKRKVGKKKNNVVTIAYLKADGSIEKTVDVATNSLKTLVAAVGFFGTNAKPGIVFQTKIKKSNLVEYAIVNPNGAVEPRVTMNSFGKKSKIVGMGFYGTNDALSDLVLATKTRFKPKASNVVSVAVAPSFNPMALTTVAAVGLKTIPQASDKLTSNSVFGVVYQTKTKVNRKMSNVLEISTYNFPATGVTVTNQVAGVVSTKTAVVGAGRFNSNMLGGILLQTKVTKPSTSAGNLIQALPVSFTVANTNNVNTPITITTLLKSLKSFVVGPK